tara:strand:- start:76 stop:552 length:477 start_codon:yes stop_codon:yes gene_type:complete
MISRFKIKIKGGDGRERWADADKVFAHLIQNYMKAELGGKKPEPYTDKVNNFFKLIDAEWVDALKKAYPNVDVDQELETAKMWLLSNTSQAKSNFKKFINNWMAKAMRNGGKTEKPVVDGRSQYPKYVVEDIPEEDLASQEEINEMMQGIKDKLARRK